MSSHICYCSKLILTSVFICLQSSFLFQHGKKVMKQYIIIFHLLLLLQGNSLITIVRSAYLLLTSNSTFMTDSLYLGTNQIWRNVNEHYCYLTSTKSVICQIDANCSTFQSLNMLPFHIRLGSLKLIYNGLISNFSKILL